MTQIEKITNTNVIIYKHFSFNLQLLKWFPPTPQKTLPWKAEANISHLSEIYKHKIENKYKYWLTLNILLDSN